MPGWPASTWCAAGPTTCRRTCCRALRPQPGIRPGTKYYEIPIVIQDRSFNADGSLFYPDSRAFFEGYAGSAADPVHPRPDVPDSDISPIWNPEFFGNTMVVNGNTWPYLEVEPRRYRFRLFNGCHART